jgi:adenine-specific DNA-methyltransferase
MGMTNKESIKEIQPFTVTRSSSKTLRYALSLFAGIPFLNGGLFECLDKPEQNIYVDGFSDTASNQPFVPDALFFGSEHEEDLSEVLGDKRRSREKVRGLIHIFNSYKFTVEENTPIEEEIALDPELLGKVFENLLAAYNPETGTTARKQTGSFYTPREIVNYMVDESLIAYLENSLGGVTDLQPRLRQLLAYTEKPHEFNKDETTRLIEAIDRVKVLDPAAGSGAFPMGILHKLVFILSKLDPGNQGWKERQIEKVAEVPDATVREKALADIDQAFADNELDYGRKLYLIENCIYGVDIQPIAVQISKLRFFISLVVEQKIDRAKIQPGIRPLPNLETKFVAANTLIGIEKPAQMMFRNPDIDIKEKRLREVRSALFTAKTPVDKKKYRATGQATAQRNCGIAQKRRLGQRRRRPTGRLGPLRPEHQRRFF